MTESVPEGTALDTRWGPAVAGPVDNEGICQQVIYRPGATFRGADIVGTVGAFELGVIAGWAATAREAAVTVDRGDRVVCLNRQAELVRGTVVGITESEVTVRTDSGEVFRYRPGGTMKLGQKE